MQDSNFGFVKLKIYVRGTETKASFNPPHAFNCIIWEDNQSCIIFSYHFQMTTSSLALPALSPPKPCCLHLRSNTSIPLVAGRYQITCLHLQAHHNKNIAFFHNIKELI